MKANNEYIVDILQNVGLISGEQSRNALRHVEKEEKDIVDILVRDVPVTKIDILKSLAAQFGMQTVSLLDVQIEPEVIESVPSVVANRYKIVPVAIEENTIAVAISDPFDAETLDSLRYVLEKDVKGVVAPEEDIDITLTRYYPEIKAK